MKMKLSEKVEKDMTRTQAQVIRGLRLSGCTFGRISEIMNELLGWEKGQYVGRRYCMKAASILEMDWSAEPWN